MTEQAIDDFFAHHGVKGMRWGVRNASDDSSPRESMSTKKKVVIGAAAGTALVGVAATAVILRKNGKLPMSSFSRSSRSAAAKTAARGKQAVQVLQEANALATKMKEFEATLKTDNNNLYKSMVDNASDAGVPTISRQEFDDIRG